MALVTIVSNMGIIHGEASLKALRLVFNYVMSYRNELWRHILQLAKTIGH